MTWQRGARELRAFGLDYFSRAGISSWAAGELAAQRSRLHGHDGELLRAHLARDAESGDHAAAVHDRGRRGTGLLGDERRRALPGA